MKKIKNKMKVNLYEKSYHKCHFPKRSFKKIKFKYRNNSKRYFEIKNIETGTIMSRAFKPMPVILNLVNENFKKYKNINFFYGKSGKKILMKILKKNGI